MTLKIRVSNKELSTLTAEVIETYPPDCDLFLEVAEEVYLCLSFPEEYGFAP